MVNTDNQADNLEKALLERATRLAEEYLQRAKQQRDDIHHDLREKLHISEERELLAAREKGERIYLQRVQASELQLQSKLDKFRWQMVEQVLNELHQKLGQLAEREDEYLPVLKYLLQDAAASISADELVVEVNPKDYKRLSSDKELLKEWLPGKKIVLSDTVCTCVGGARVHDRDNRIKVDNTFEGRIKILHEELEESIVEHLFSKAMTTSEMLHG